MSYVLSLLIFLPLIGSATTYSVSRVGGGRKGVTYSALAFSLATLLVSGYSFMSVYSNTPPLGQYALTESHDWIRLPGFGLQYLLGMDGLSSPLVLVSSILTVLSIVSSRTLIDKNEPAYYALLLFAEGSIMGAFTSLNLIAFYVFWELTLIPIFFLIGVWGGDRRRYAAMKFIVFTFAGSAIMLLGFLSLYLGVSPTTFNIPDLAGKVPAGLQYLPLLAVFVGFAVELPVFPFHSWQPDAYEQAPAPVNVLLSGLLPKFAGYGVIRIGIGLFPQAAYQYAWAFILVAIISMFYGAVVALIANDLKRMFAYTSINHMGFVLFGAFAAVASGNPLGIQGAVLLMFTHALAIGALFTLSGFIEAQAGTRKITLLGAMRQRMPRTAALLVVASAAAIGIPPFASFLAELFIISAGISAYAWTAITVLVPVLTGAYFLWMLKRTVFDPWSPPSSSPATTTGGNGQTRDISGADAGAIILYMVPLILLTVFSFLVLSPAAPVAQWAVHLASGGAHP